jgi:hypothetical protein
MPLNEPEGQGLPAASAAYHFIYFDLRYLANKEGRNGSAIIFWHPHERTRSGYYIYA